MTEVSKIFVMWGIHGGHAKKFLSELVPFFRWPFNVKFSWLCTSWVVLHTAHAIPRKSTYFFFSLFLSFFAGNAMFLGHATEGGGWFYNSCNVLYVRRFCAYMQARKSPICNLWHQKEEGKKCGTHVAFLFPEKKKIT